MFFLLVCFYLRPLKIDLYWKATRVKTRDNTTQHETTQDDTRQHEYYTRQHKTTRVLHETKQDDTSTTRDNTSRKKLHETTRVKKKKKKNFDRLLKGSSQVNLLCKTYIGNNILQNAVSMNEYE